MIQFCRRLRVVLAGMTLGLMAAAGTTASAEIPGQDASEFTVALETWLDDDEEAALPQLAALAQNENVAAQMLLALIDKTPSLQGPWLARSSRDERIDLMRAPGGISGRSWMHAAAQRSDLAAYWLELWRVDARPELPFDFIAAGEDRAARAMLVTLAAREIMGFHELVLRADYPQSMWYLGWSALPAEAVETLEQGDPQRLTLGAQIADEALADWIAAAPETAALREFCSARCSRTADACAVAAYRGLRDYASVMTFGTPAETLIPNEVFVASPRGQAALLRRVMLTTQARGRPHLLSSLQQVDACFATELEAEIERYRPVPLKLAE